MSKRYWLDSHDNVTKLVRGLYVVCLVLVLFDLVMGRHEEFGFAEWFGFYGGFGFVACVGLVLAAKAMRRIVMRSEDYYDR